MPEFLCLFIGCILFIAHFSPDPPGSPRNLHVEGFSKDFITIAWEPPETDGGSKIIQYVVEKCDVTRGLGQWVNAGSVSPSEHSFKTSKLFQGNAYLFRVRAENRVGAGPSAELTQPAVAELPFGTYDNYDTHNL